MRIFPSELTIGFEQSTYTTNELDGTVTVCAEILEGSVQRSVGVSFDFRAQDGTAGERYILYCVQLSTLSADYTEGVARQFIHGVNMWTLMT